MRIPKPSSATMVADASSSTIAGMLPQTPNLKSSCDTLTEADALKRGHWGAPWEGGMQWQW